jgi:hypothetical protein
MPATSDQPPAPKPPASSSWPPRGVARFGVGALAVGSALMLAGWLLGRHNLLLIGGLVFAAGAVTTGLP